MAQNIFLPLITPIIKPMIGNKKTIFPTPTNIRGSLQLIKRLMEQGLFKAVIDREYPLERIVERYKYVEKGQKIGNVVITVEHNNKTWRIRITNIFICTRPHQQLKNGNISTYNGLKICNQMM